MHKTDQIYNSDHFSARNLCSADRYLASSNLCASEGIIGPISDIEHVSQDERDGYEVDFYDEDDEDDWDDDDDWEYIDDWDDDEVDDDKSKDKQK